MKKLIKLLKSRNQYSMKMDNRKGTPENPMTEEEFINKFRDCLAHGRKHLSKQKAEKIMHLINKLEEVDDVGNNKKQDIGKTV